MIGIITSQTENYPLIKLCHHHNLAYTIIADTLLQSYQDQEHTTIKAQTLKLIEYGQSV